MQDVHACVKKGALWPWWHILPLGFQNSTPCLSACTTHNLPRKQPPCSSNTGRWPVQFRSFTVAWTRGVLFADRPHAGPSSPCAPTMKPASGETPAMLFPQPAMPRGRTIRALPGKRYNAHTMSCWDRKTMKAVERRGWSTVASSHLTLSGPHSCSCCPFALCCVLFCCFPFVLCCVVLCCVVLCCVVLCCVVLCCVVLCSVLLCSVVLCCVVFCRVVLCCVVL